MTQDFAAFISWAFYGIVGGAVVYGVRILSEVNDSINTLNVQIAVVIEKSKFHEEKLSDHSKRLNNLEQMRH